MKRLLPERAPITEKPASILDVFSVQDREALETLLNLFGAIEQAMELHRPCCDIYSPEAIAHLREMSAFLVRLATAYDEHEAGVFFGYSEPEDRPTRNYDA